MDPVSKIVNAYSEGLEMLLTGKASRSDFPLFLMLSDRLKKLIGQDEEARIALESLEKKPDSGARQAFLSEELTRLGIDRDDQLVNLSQGVLEEIGSTYTASGKYNVSISSGSGIVIGDAANASQSIKIGKSSKE